MKSRKLWLITALLLIASMVLAACGATPTATPVPPTATKPAAAPAATQPPAAPTATKAPAGPTKGGKVTMAVWQSPITLSPLLGNQTVMDEVHVFIIEGFTGVMPNGDRFPVLAKEVPTVQNGGISADGKTITYKLKDNLKWSDGTALTCSDVQFTQEAIMTPGVGVVSTTGYSEIDKIECPDPQTVVIKMKQFYGPYMSLFDNLIMPKHYCGDPKGLKDWAYNRKPMGTGPFKLDEWVADSHIILSRNTNFRDAGKPLLDQVVIRIVPSAEVAMQLLASGEIDIMWNNVEADIPQLEKMTGVKLSSPLQPGGERMFLNTAENKDPSDPKKPHPILSDVKVRQAISYGINKQRIIEKLLGGKAPPTGSELNAGYYNCTSVKPYPYDPAKAKQLLDEAGWVPGADGIRVAKGSKTAPDGTRLRLKYSTTSGIKLREDSQVLVVEDMKAIGVEMYIENAPSSVVIGSWDAASPRRRGNFDIIMYTTNASIDPHSQMVNLFASSSIPSEANKGGTNYTRFSDPKVDDLLKQAAAEPDLAKRRDLYCQICQIAADQAIMIYLYQRFDLDSYRDWLQGWEGNPWDNNGWNAEDWWIKK